VTRSRGLRGRRAASSGVVDSVRTSASRAGFTLTDAQEQALAVLVGGSRGVYLWGPVGQGKTWLVDAFAEAVGAEGRRRFHSFDVFRDLHAAVHRHGRRLPAHSTENAVDRAVDDLLAGCRVMLLDELHLHDVGDAMLLARLLRHLFERRVRLVATSNYRPGELLPNPHVHHLLEPTITRIHAAMDVVEVSGSPDLREGRHGAAGGFASGAWLVPGTAPQLHGLGLGPPEPVEQRTLRPGGHPLPVRALRPTELWASFADLCAGRRSAADYLALTAQATTWVVSDVPPLVLADPQARQRFASLVDVLADRDVRLVVTSRHTPEEALDLDGASGDVPPDLARTRSRVRLLSRAGRP
jgi:cell division protein ZapE